LSEPGRILPDFSVINPGLPRVSLGVPNQVTIPNFEDKRILFGEARKKIPRRLFLPKKNIIDPIKIASTIRLDNEIDIRI
jgi:hypothetical protein